MSVLSRLVKRTTGRSIGANVGAAVGTLTGGSILGIPASIFGDTLSEELSRQSNRAEPTQTQTVPSDMGPQMPMGPAQNIEIDFRGGSDVPMLNTAQMGNNPFIQPASFQQANVIPFIRPGIGAVGTAIGAGAAVIMDLLTGQPTKLIITRKLQREARQAADFYMNDLDMVAEYLSRVKKKRFTEDIVVDILLKRFTNQGPFVTKAAVRKTRATVRKLNTLSKLQAEICKPTTRARARRTTARATASAMAK
tara:strand:+ start:731 stop:1483 length:753 start_codon:yes stop_codon:yes gene_type:complete